MPSIATHYIFGQDLLQKADDSIKNTLKQSIGAFQLGLQGPDIFFYDLIHSSIARNKSIGKIMHKRRTDIFFYKYIDYLREHKLYKNPTALSYFYGMLCHYSLDCIAHPFIYYFTNLQDKSTSGIRKSLDCHVLFESNIDELLYHDKTGKNICNINRTEFMNISKNEIAIISPIIAYAISETYKCDITKNYVRGSIKRGLKINSMLNNKYAIKRPILGILEKTILGNNFGKNMMYTRKLPSRMCLNEHHQKWHLPVDNKEFYSSFQDLYNQGLTNALDLITMATDVMGGRCSISSFIRATGGKSYHTGIEWRLNNEMQYFKN